MERSCPVEDFSGPTPCCPGRSLQRLWYAVVIIAGVCLSLSGGCDRGETPDDEVAQPIQQSPEQEVSQQSEGLDPSYEGEDEKTSGDDTPAEGEHEAEPDDPAEGEAEHEAESGVYAAGADGVVLEYDGENWQLIDFPEEDGTIRDVWTTDDADLFVLGEEAVYRLDTRTDGNGR